MECAPIHFKQKIFQRPKAATVMCARKIVFCIGEFPDSFGFGIEYIPKNHDWDCKQCRNTVNGRTWKDISSQDMKLAHGRQLNSGNQGYMRSIPSGV